MNSKTLMGIGVLMVVCDPHLERVAGVPSSGYQREAAEKDREFNFAASALEEKRELNEEEAARLKPLCKKLVRTFHPDLHEHDPEKRQGGARGAHAPSRVDFSALAEIMRRIKRTA